MGVGVLVLSGCGEVAKLPVLLAPVAAYAATSTSDSDSDGALPGVHAEVVGQHEGKIL
jgi:hypothetical protein